MVELRVWSIKIRLYILELSPASICVIIVNCNKRATSWNSELRKRRFLSQNLFLRILFDNRVLWLSIFRSTCQKARKISTNLDFVSSGWVKIFNIMASHFIGLLEFWNIGILAKKISVSLEESGIVLFFFFGHPWPRSTHTIVLIVMKRLSHEVKFKVSDWFEIWPNARTHEGRPLRDVDSSDYAPGDRATGDIVYILSPMFSCPWWTSTSAKTLQQPMQTRLSTLRGKERGGFLARMCARYAVRFIASLWTLFLPAHPLLASGCSQVLFLPQPTVLAATRWFL